MAWPKHEGPYDFEAWDQEHFRRAGEILTTIAQKRSGIDKMRDVLLQLYFNEGESDGLS